jgi:hypothetical protein
MYEIKLQQSNVSVCHDTLNFITALILTQIENHLFTVPTNAHFIHFNTKISY